MSLRLNQRISIKFCLFLNLILLKNRDDFFPEFSEFAKKQRQTGVLQALEKKVFFNFLKKLNSLIGIKPIQCKKNS